MEAVCVEDWAWEALDSLLRSSLSVVSRETILEELLTMFKKRTGVMLISSTDESCSIGTLHGKSCLIPGRIFPVGSRVKVEAAFPAAPGLPFELWTQQWTVLDAKSEWQVVARPPSMKPVSRQKKR